MLVLAGMALAQAPVIYVQNAAIGTTVSNSPPWVVPIAPGSLINIAVLPSSYPAISDPTTVTASIRQTGCNCQSEVLPIANIQAFYGSIIARVPLDFPTPSFAEITISFDAKTSAPAPVTLAPSSIQLFTSNGMGSGPALAQITANDGTVAANSLTRPARTGEFVTIWGTGLGLSKPDQVMVLLGGHPATVTYAGPAPGYPGLDQINFQAPSDPAIPDGCYVALWVTAPGSRSNTESISKSSTAGSCLSPFGFTPTQLANLDSGGYETLGELRLDTQLAPPLTNGVEGSGFVRQDSTVASFFPTPEGIIALNANPLLADDSRFGCTFAPAFAGTALFLVRVEDTLNVGDFIALAGPGAMLTLQGGSFGEYTAAIPASTVQSTPDAVTASFFNPGTWVASALGSSAAMPFQASLDVPTAIQTTNYSATAIIDRSQDLTITWASAGYSSEDTVAFALFGQQSFPGVTAAMPVALSCLAPAQSGQLTLPATLLSQFDATTQAAGAGISINLQRSTVFPVTVNSGDPVPTLFSYNSGETYSVILR